MKFHDISWNFIRLFRQFLENWRRCEEFSCDNERNQRDEIPSQKMDEIAWNLIVYEIYSTIRMKLNKINIKFMIEFHHEISLQPGKEKRSLVLLENMGFFEIMDIQKGKRTKSGGKLWNVIAYNRIK